MRKITRPGVDLSKITLIEETIEKQAPKALVSNIKDIIRESNRRRKNKHSDEDKRLEIVQGSKEESFPMRAGEIFKFYLESKNGRFVNNGKVVYFLTKNAAKRTRKIVNKKIGREVYWVEKLTDEQLSRNFPVMSV